MLQPEIPARVVSLDQVRALVRQCRSDIYIAASGSTYRKPMVYLHVSAGWWKHLGVDEEHYTFCIDDEGTIYLPEAHADLSVRGQHTAGRNSGSIGIAILSCVDAIAKQTLGPNPPTAKQIETMAQLTCVVCEELGLPITYEYVRTHAEQADEDGYGPNTTCERWDLWYLRDGDEPGTGGQELRGKAEYYRVNGLEA